MNSPQEIQLSMQEINFVDLIEQPAWKSILFDLVNSEKMDLWNIDLTALSEKYLLKINALESRNLVIPANAILCSAILLKMKSRVLKVTEIEDEDEFLSRKKEEEKQLAEMNFVEQLPELKSIHRMKEGRISLDELVDQIEGILSKTKKNKSNLLHELDNPEFRIPLARLNIDAKMKEVMQLIEDKVDSQGLTTFNAILFDKSITQIVECFIAMLFLMNREKINAWQDEFFGEIFISLNQEEKKK